MGASSHSSRRKKPYSGRDQVRDGNCGYTVHTTRKWLNLAAWLLTISISGQRHLEDIFFDYEAESTSISVASISTSGWKSALRPMTRFIRSPHHEQGFNHRSSRQGHPANRLMQSDWLEKRLPTSRSVNSRVRNSARGPQQVDRYQYERACGSSSANPQAAIHTCGGGRSVDAERRCVGPRRPSSE